MLNSLFPIKGNILVDSSGIVKISNFGTSRINDNRTVAETKNTKGNVRWMAVELLMNSESGCEKYNVHTKQSNVWAFGMVVYVGGNIVVSNLSLIIAAGASV